MAQDHCVRWVGSPPKPRIGGAMKLMGRLAQLCALNLLGVAAQSGYVFVTSPGQKAIYYAKLLSASEQSRNQPMKAEVLTQKGQVKEPMGLAVDSVRKLVFVADAGAKSVLGFRILENPTKGKIQLSTPVYVLSGVAPNWVAVDSVGNLYVSDTTNKRIFKLPASTVAARMDGRRAGGFPQELYSRSTQKALVAPQGIAVDRFHLFFTNGDGGLNAGTVVGGFSDKGDSSVRVLSRAEPGAYGLCMSSSRIFYTGKDKAVYSLEAGVAENSTAVVITDKLKEPRGCSYDGDGTVFVADRTAGKVFSFSGGAPHIGGMRNVSIAFEVKDAYDVAVLTA